MTRAERDGARRPDLARAVAAPDAVLPRRQAVPRVRDGGRSQSRSMAGSAPIRSKGWTTSRAIPGSILHQGGRVEIYSRAHSDRYAYFLPLYTMEGLGELLKSLGEPDEGAERPSLNDEAEKAKKGNKGKGEELKQLTTWTRSRMRLQPGLTR